VVAVGGGVEVVVEVDEVFGMVCEWGGWVEWAASGLHTLGELGEFEGCPVDGSEHIVGVQRWQVHTSCLHRAVCGSEKREKKTEHGRTSSFTSGRPEAYNNREAENTSLMTKRHSAPSQFHTKFNSSYFLSYFSFK